MLNKLIGLFKKKNKKMSFADKTLEEIESSLKNSDFQWIKGEQTGMVEKYDSIVQEGPNKFLVFKGGGRINLEILNEFLDIFPSTPINFEVTQNAPPQIIQPRPESSPRGTVNSIEYGSGSNSGIEDSPIYKLLKKQKPNWVNVNISLKLNLPTKSLYNVLVSSFDDAETEIANYVTEGIEIEDIRNAIAESIKSSFYETKSKTPKKEKESDEISED
jgi:hypothetical protein